MCSGPFKFVERVAQDHVTLERFADYWDAKDIHFDKVVYQVLVDPSVRLANLKAGTIDLAEYVAPTDVAAVKADPKLRLVLSDALGYSGITNNLDNGPRSNTPYGQNALVRQAFDAAIDRAALVNVVFNGHVHADRAGGAAKLAVLRRRVDAAAARCGEGKGVAASRPA